MSTTRRNFIQTGAAAMGAQGLELRPLAVTAHDTLEWFKWQDQARQDKLLLHLERDAAIIKVWKQ